MAVKMNLRIITKNHAADPGIGFLEKSISKSNGCATAIPTAWELPSDSRRIKHAYFSDQIEIMQKLLSSELKLQTLTMFFPCKREISNKIFVTHLSS